MDSDLQELKPSLQNSIEKITKKANFLQYNVAVKAFNTRGNSFLGKLYEIDIKGITSECEKEINIFVKERIILKKLEVINTEELYARERLIYHEISKIITSLQDEANIPLEERFKIAKAYYETSDDIIILENLSKKGFKTYGKAEIASLKFVELGVQELAKLHALSFVIENKMPEYFKKKIAVLESSIHYNEDWKGMMRSICRYVASLYDDETKIRIENFVPVLLEKLPKYSRDKTNKCTLSHGDYKKNNIMFRTINDELVEVIPVDYQFLDYGCPIRDLLFFIFSGTDREFRRKHLNDIKELYFETLSKFLKYFDMEVETVYPRKEFETIYTEWLDYGLMMTLYFSLAMFTPEIEMSFENCNYADILPFSADKKYDNMYRGLVDDFVEWGYL